MNRFISLTAALLFCWPASAQQPAPAINATDALSPGLSQNVAPYYGGPFVLTVNGANFQSGAVVSMGATNLSTTFVNSTQLTAQVPATALAALGMQPVKVTNPDSQPSNIVNFLTVVRGDINFNSSISIGDALTLALKVGGLNRPPLPLSVGDLNLNGTVNISDALTQALFTGGLRLNWPVPAITSPSPLITQRNTPFTISGTGFGPNPADNLVLFPIAGGGVIRVQPSAVGSNTLTVTAPPQAINGLIQVYRVDVPLGGVEYPFSVSCCSAPLALISISPASGVLPGNTVLLTGTGFGNSIQENTVLFKTSTGAAAGTITSLASGLTVSVPPDAVCGPVNVTVAGQISNSRMLLVQGTNCGLQLAGIWGDGSPGETLVIEGAGFDVFNPANNIVKFQSQNGGSVSAPVLAAGITQLHVRIPDNAIAGTVTVSVGNNTSNGILYHVAVPALTSLTPTFGNQGSAVPVTIRGTGFLSGATAITVSGTGITVANLSVVDSTTLTATFNVDAQATLGMRNVNVTLTNGPTSAPLTFSITPAGFGQPTQFLVSTLAGNANSGAVDGTGTAAQFSYPEGIWGDSTNLYVADHYNSAIRRIVRATGAVSTFAGSLGNYGYGDGIGTNARFTYIGPLWGDGTNLYVGESSGIRKIVIATGEVTTLPVTFLIVGGIWGDGANLYVTSVLANVVKKLVLSTNEVTTIAGSSGFPGTADGIGAAARFNGPAGIWGDGTNLYVTDSLSHTIRKIVIATGEVTTLAGLALHPGTAEGIGSAARFNYPSGIWGDNSNLYVADLQNQLIRRIISATGEVFTLAGRPGGAAHFEGLGPDSAFSTPKGIWGDGSQFYITEEGNEDIRRAEWSYAAPQLKAVSPNSGAMGTTVSVTLTGTNFTSSSLAVGFAGQTGGVGITVTNVSLVNSTTITADFVISNTTTPGTRQFGVQTQFGSSFLQIFTITPPAGTPALTGIVPPFGTQGSSTTVTLRGMNFVPGAAAISASGSQVSVSNISVINNTTLTATFTVGSAASLGTRNITVSVNGLTSNIQTFSVAPTGFNGSPTQLQVSTFAGDTSSGAVDEAGESPRFSNPTGVWGDGTNLYVTDDGDKTIRKIVLATRAVTLFAGFPSYQGDRDEIGSDAQFDGPAGIWGDGSNLFVVDGSAVRKIVIATRGVTTLAGNTSSNASRDGTGLDARFFRPRGIWGDGANLYVADTGNHAIRKIVISTAEVTTLAGSLGISGSADGTGPTARFKSPEGVWGDGTYLYIADSGNNTIRRIVTATGEVTTVAGTAGTTGGIDAHGAAALFNYPSGIWGDGVFLYVTEYSGNTIRKVRIADGEVMTLAGLSSLSGFTGGLGQNARFRSPRFIWGDSSALYVAEEWYNSDVRIGTFSVIAPELRSFAPLRGAPGTTVNVTLTGANFVPGSTVTGPSSLTISNVVVVNETTITASFTILSNSSGSANITVSTPFGTSYPHSFLINTGP